MNDRELEGVLAILALAAQAETAVGDFYRACSARCGKDADYWLGLAAEEDGHAAMVRKMRALVAAHPDRYSLAKPLDPEYYRSFIAWVEANTDEVENGPYGAERAAEAAQDIENAVYESKFQDLFSTVDEDYKALAALITAQTGRHCALVKAKAEKLIK